MGEEGGEERDSSWVGYSYCHSLLKREEGRWLEGLGRMDGWTKGANCFDSNVL